LWEFSFGGLQGGTGIAKNFVYKNVEMTNVANPIIIDQSYCPHQTTNPCSTSVSNRPNKLSKEPVRFCLVCLDNRLYTWCQVLAMAVQGLTYVVRSIVNFSYTLWVVEEDDAEPAYNGKLISGDKSWVL
jgi:polygalacturonase